MCIILWLLSALPLAAIAQPDPLPSWNDGAAKNAIIGFIQGATDPAHVNYIPPAERIASLDQDGTLWVAPLYPQFYFALDKSFGFDICLGLSAAKN